MTKKTRIRYGELTPARPIAAVLQRTHTPAIPAVAVPGPVEPSAGPHRAATSGAPPRSLRDRAAAKNGTADVLMFRVGDEHFAVELGAVEEAIDLPGVHQVPEMPDAMLGVITVRGSLTSLYSPRRALGLPPAPGHSALVFRRGASRVALSIDDVDDVLSLDLAVLRDPPDPSGGRGLLLGVARYGRGLIALLDADALLGACAAAPLQETA